MSDRLEAAWNWPIPGGGAMIEPALVGAAVRLDLVIGGEDDPSGPLRNARVLAPRVPPARVYTWSRAAAIFVPPRRAEDVAGVIGASLNEDR